MPRPRRNDPLGVSDNPRIVTDPVREAEAAAEFQRKFRYLVSSYQVEKISKLNQTSFNSSLARLKAASKKSNTEESKPQRLNPWLEMAINMRAKELAGLAPDERLEDKHGVFIAQASRDVAVRAKAIRGAPGRGLVRRYTLGMMALIQETTSKPVMGRRDKDSVYEPHLPGLAGQALRLFVDQLEPGISDSAIGYWIREARRKYAGKPMRFSDMFPGYGMSIEPASGQAVLQAPFEILETSLCHPIYCP